VTLTKLHGILQNPFYSENTSHNEATRFIQIHQQMVMKNQIHGRHAALTTICAAQWSPKLVNFKDTIFGNTACWMTTTLKCWLLKFWVQNIYINTYKVWSKTTVNAAAECDPTERRGSSIEEAAGWTLVTMCDKFELVQCSQLVVSYGWEVYFKVCHKSWITNNALFFI
jgi:hypothetical protein